MPRSSAASSTVSVRRCSMGRIVRVLFPPTFPCRDAGGSHVADFDRASEPSTVMARPARNSLVPGRSDGPVVPDPPRVDPNLAAPITALDMGPLGGEGVGGIGEAPTYVVSRGPCYLALRTLVGRTLPHPLGSSWSPTTGAPSPSATSRTCSACRSSPASSTGLAWPAPSTLLLVYRLHKRAEFRELRRLARRLFGPTTDQAVA